MNSTLPLVVNSRLAPDGLDSCTARRRPRHRPTCSLSDVPHVRHRDAERHRGRRRLAVCQMRAALGRPTAATVAAYAEWAHRDRVARRVTEGDHIAVTFGDAAVEPVDGRP